MPYVMVGTENGASMAVLLLGLAGVAPAQVPAREFPTRRRVYRRNPGSTPDRSLAAITLDIHDITAT